ncbi:MAG: hypothetical protein A3F13_07720 [Gammaproteobacteria bacterium RIFCSPHIGHO2_12_FULL_40_19]|nr:MAG: hypothetical protein A3F13_07720 [Gammaproteobacteria bacterium RIFCSPHIGHO2_12_FULL_40_19]
MKNYEPEHVKVIVIGETNTVKTIFSVEPFFQTSKPSIGVDLETASVKAVESSQSVAELKIWNIARQEVSSPMISTYARHAQALVYIDYQSENVQVSHMRVMRLRARTNEELPIIRVSQPDKKNQVEITCYLPKNANQAPLVTTCPQSEVQKRVKDLTYAAAVAYQSYQREQRFVEQRQAQIATHTKSEKEAVQHKLVEEKKGIFARFVDVLKAGFHAIFSRNCTAQVHAEKKAEKTTEEVIPGVALDANRNPMSSVTGPVDGVVIGGNSSGLFGGKQKGVGYPVVSDVSAPRVH